MKVESYGNLDGIKLIFGKTRELLAESEVAIITSGTATLEAALLGTKQVIAYKTSSINFLIAKLLVKVKHIGLPNLILGREIIPELIQSDCSANKIETSLIEILNTNQQETELKELRVNWVKAEQVIG